MKQLIEYLKELGATKVKLMDGGNGRYIRYWTGTDESFTLPCGSSEKSQSENDLSKFLILVTEDGQPIATVNKHQEIAVMEL